MTEHKATFCRICEPLCGMIATVEDGRLVALRPDKDHPLSSGFACQKGIAFTEVVNDPDRVTVPLRRGPNGFEQVTWDEAMTDIAARLTVQLLASVRSHGLHQRRRTTLPLLHRLVAGHQQQACRKPVPLRRAHGGADTGSGTH